MKFLFTVNCLHKPYFCTICGKQYKHMASLRSHLKFECGKEPQFSCAMCSRKFSIKSNCRRHELLVHNNCLSLNSIDIN